MRCRINMISPGFKRSGYVLEVKKIHSKFYLPLFKTDSIQARILVRKNYYERDYLEKLCKKWNNGLLGHSIRDSVILDIGANIGNHSLYFLNEYGAKFAYCFEPVKETYDILKKNIEINNLNNKSKIFNLGVGSSDSKAVISKSVQGNTGMTQLTTSEDGDIDIVAIDDMNISEKIGFVKIDVEGFELDVIKGMIKVLKRDKPFIMIEIWKKNETEVLNILKEIGYTHEEMERRAILSNHIFYQL